MRRCDCGDLDTALLHYPGAGLVCGNVSERKRSPGATRRQSNRDRRICPRRGKSIRLGTDSSSRF